MSKIKKFINNFIISDTKQNTRKIGNISKSCSDKEHNPPMHIVYEDGIYEHICPNCGCKQIFTVQKPTF